jgi:predicted ATPase
MKVVEINQLVEMLSRTNTENQLNISTQSNKVMDVICYHHVLTVRDLSRGNLVRQ